MQTILRTSSSPDSPWLGPLRSRSTKLTTVNVTCFALLRDGLDDDWVIARKFEIAQGVRSYECDALVVGCDGWGYLVETKAWSGRVRGNDQQWELSSLVGGGPSYRPNPLNVTTQKSRILKDLLVREDPVLKGLYLQPVVVVASTGPLELTGKCADQTVLITSLLGRSLRTHGHSCPSRQGH